jgi:2-methylisocitrate lyase-like PEP mutase family enzyme
MALVDQCPSLATAPLPCSPAGLRWLPLRNRTTASAEASTSTTAVAITAIKPWSKATWARPSSWVAASGGSFFDAEQLGALGYGIVLYANAALQGAVAGMQKTLTVLRDEKAVQESSGLVATFAERQRLVGKPGWDALEKRFS